MHQPHAVDDVAEAAWSALGPAVVTRPSGTTADSLRALARAARAQKNSRLVLTRFVDSVLPGFVRVSQTLRSAQDTELLPLLEEALQAGLFAPAVAAGHVAAVDALATPEPREPGKRQRTDGGGSSAPVKGEPSDAFSPQSLLYSSVCERVRAGDTSYTSLLPWLLTCVATLHAGSANLQSGPERHSFSLLCALLSSLEEGMAGFCARADSEAWGSTVAASCDLLRVAHRLGVLAHVSNSPETLPAHLSLVLQQSSVLGSTLASASAAALVEPLIDIDTRLVAVHLRPMWRAVWLGSASSPEPCRAAACNLIAAFGDTRQLDLLLLETSAAMRNSLAGESAGMAAVMCASDVAAAWYATAACAPAAQVKVVLEAVSECLAQAVSTDMSGGQSTALLGPLAETLSSVIAGVCVTPATAAAVSLAATALQTRVDELTHSFLPLELALHPAAALLIRVSFVTCQLKKHCADHAGSAANVDAAASLFHQLCRTSDSTSPLAPWLHLELCRFALRWIPQASAVRCFEHLASPILRAGAGAVWDGTVSTVSTGSLPCAIWSLCTAHAQVWCPHTSKRFLESFVECLLRSYAVAPPRASPTDLGLPPPRLVVTVEGCSAELLSDAELYELHHIRTLLPSALQSELENATRALELSLRKPSSTPDFQPLLCLLRLAAQFPVGYLPEERASSLARKLLSWEEMLLPAPSDALWGSHHSCLVFAEFRAALAQLLRSAGERGRASACKRAPRLLLSLDGLASHISSSLSSQSVPQSGFLDAVRHTADVFSLLSDRALLVESVLAFGVSNTDSSAGRLARAEIALAALSRTASGAAVKLDVAALSSWRSHACALVLELCDVSGREPSSAWPAQSALVSPLLGALGASLAVARPEQPADVAALLHRALLLLSAGSVDEIRVLGFVRAALRSGGDNSALHAQLVAVLQVLLNRAEWKLYGEAVLETAAVVFDCADAASRSVMMETLLAAAQEAAMMLDVCDTSVGELRAALQLLACVLTRTAAHAEPGMRVDGERCLAVALLSGDALATHKSCLVGSSDHACLVVVKVVTTLLSSRRHYPLRSSSISQALQLPIALFSDARRLTSGCCEVFAVCCELLTASIASRPLEMQRCMPLLALGARALLSSLLHSMDEAAPGEKLLSCAARFGALYKTVSENSAHSRYCSLLLSDYITCAAELRIDTTSHSLFHALEIGLHALLMACSSRELQQLHVNLGAGFGGVRPGMLAQLRDQHESTKYTGRV